MKPKASKNDILRISGLTLKRNSKLLTEKKDTGGFKDRYRHRIDDMLSSPFCPLIFTKTRKRNNTEKLEDQSIVFFLSVYFDCSNI